MKKLLIKIGILTTIFVFAATSLVGCANEKSEKITKISQDALTNAATNSAVESTLKENQED